MYKICVVTGTRAEYSLLKPVIKMINESTETELLLAVTGSHLSEKFGMTVKEIEEDGFSIAERIDIGVDEGLSVAEMTSLALSRFGTFFSKERPDIVVILGDRYEVFGAASAAALSGIPIAHIHGGELTQGAVDDALRHCITKLSYLHFPATENYRKRIIQLGECPDRVICAGSLGVENIKKTDFMPLEELEKSLGISLDKDTKNLILTYHPETLDGGSVLDRVNEIIGFIDERSDIFVIITGANADKDGETVNYELKNYAEAHPDKCRFFMSLGQRRYYSLLKFCDCVIGNSSSGIIEVPSFKIPTINIGDRQKGRDRAASVIDVTCDRKEINQAFDKIISPEFSLEMSKITNPYEAGNTSTKIFEKILSELKKGIDLKKSFYDITL